MTKDEIDNLKIGDNVSLVYYGDDYMEGIVTNVHTSMYYGKVITIKCNDEVYDFSPEELLFYHYVEKITKNN